MNLILCLLSLVSAQEPRSFSMGFTTWPYDLSQEAVVNTYQLAQDNGDLLTHHLMSGIPWPEALAATPYHQNVWDDIASRLAQTREASWVYLAIDPLDAARKDLAPYWGSSTHMPLPDPFDHLDFDDARVIDAYTNFALDVIDAVKPSYFNYGTEASELILNSPERWPQFVAFAAQVYAGIKTQHPNLPLLISAAIKSPSSAQGQLLRNRLPDILPYVDLLGISVYPYAFFELGEREDPNQLPADWLSAYADLSEGKPIAITETGWIAQDLEIPEFGLSVSADGATQRAYTDRLLREANRLQARFVVWFSVVDFSALWEGALNRDPLAAIWRDSGLYDESLQARPALAVWDAWRQQPYRHMTWLPHLATQWHNYLLLDQLAPGPTQVHIDTFGEDGSPQGTQARRFTFSQHARLDAQLSGAHSARLSSDIPVHARLAYVHPSQGGVAEFEADGQTHSDIIFLFGDYDPDDVSLTWKGIAWMNTGEADVDVELAAFDHQGKLVGQAQTHMQPHQRRRALLEDLFQTLADPLTVNRVTAHCDAPVLQGLAIAGDGGARLLFTRATGF